MTAIDSFGVCWLCWGEGLEAVVDAVAEFFAGLKIGDVFSTEGDCVASLGVAAYAGGAVMKGEAAKATDLGALVVD